MPVTLRHLTDEDTARAVRVFTTALELPMLSAEARERRRAGWFADRALAAFDGAEMVGTASALPFRTRLPGGADVPTAGLSRVGVLPSHRRRGVLTQLMARHLTDAAEHGEVLGSLRASQSPIYGRFGYGLAGYAADLRIDVRRSRFHHEPTVPGRFRVLQGPELAEVLPPLYERCRRRAGMLARDAWVWLRLLSEVADPDPTVGRWVVVHEDAAGVADGYADWHVVDRDRWERDVARIGVGELLATSDEVEAALWRFVLDLDLVEEVVAEGRPVDDLLRDLLVDTRAYGTTGVWDEQWLRLVDVAAVLGARTYTGDDSVVIEVTHDPVLPRNQGRYEVGNAGCRRVRRAPDLRLDVATLAAVSLGGVPFRRLAAAGRIEARTASALVRADALFAVSPAPWCGTFF